MTVACAPGPRPTLIAPPPAGGRDRIVLIVSIDTEEDNWDAARDGISVRNIAGLTRQHAFLRRLGVRATYFTNYAVARDPSSAAILREIRDDGGVELAAHLHPWNTPPLSEPFEPRATMLKNLSPALQAAKIGTLTDTLAGAFGAAPNAFRAGRWGIAGPGIAALLAAGYRVDSSVIPYLDWRKVADGPDHRGAPLDPYRLDGTGDVRVPTAGGLIEMPASCAFTRRPFAAWNRIYSAAEAVSTPLLPIAAAMRKLGVVRRVGLTPETHTVHDLLAVSRALINAGTRQLHLFWHSPSMTPGLSPFVRTGADLDRFYASIESYIDGLVALAPLTFATVSEAAEVLAPGAP
jgi:peptidoglycan/xylan/chitin deacetylase (PgdA/CDA1 family)